MATLIGDYAAEPSRFHTMIATPGLQYSQQHSEPPHYRSTSRSREAPSRQQSQSSSSPSRTQTQSWSAQTPSSSSSTSRHSTAPQPPSGRGSAIATPADKQHPTSSSGGASRFPSPPDSSSPSGSAASASRSDENLARSQHGHKSSYMDSTAHDFAQEASSSASTQSTVIAAPPSTSSRGPQAIPSPTSDSGAPWSAASHNDRSSSSPQPQTQTTIHVRDLAHIQSLARADLLSGNGPGILNDPPLQAMKYEISGMPISDIIEMVAALLTKITTTNDLQHDALNRNANHVKQAQAQNEGSAGENHMSPMSSSVLAFHGKNVPAITILSYLSRIHKYCPTTYEVFLSLLVYFDRMTERVNDIVMKAEEARRSGQTTTGSEQPQADVVMRDEGSHAEDETDEDLADDSDDEDMGGAPKPANDSRDGGAATSEAARSTSAPINQQATFFVVDSFNIHRLIIAGVTCASKFFSDVFYTNSRYAKVGGLPLAELNHLELQFLLLNDFRLAVPVEDLEAYATMLVEFYAREVVAQRSRPVVSME